MFAGGLLLGMTLVFFGIWLQWTEGRGWPHDSFDGDEDTEYRLRRRRLRTVVNALIGFCGGLIVSAAFAGGGVVFLAAWSMVTLVLIVILALAGFDALRTHRHHRDKLKRLRDQAFKD